MNSKLLVVNDSSFVLHFVSSAVATSNQLELASNFARDKRESIPRNSLKSIIEKHLEITEGEENEEIFRRTYRLSHEEFHWLYSHLGEHKKVRWDLKFQALVFIEWLKSKAHLEQIGRIFNMPTTTVHNTVNRILACVLKLRSSLIYLPIQSELIGICKGFASKAGDSRFFPNVVGAIDGSLVNLIVPEDQLEAYFDRHLNCSMNLTAICDHNMAVRFLFVGKTGACHDANVLKETSIYKNRSYPPKDYIILGDSAYPNCLEPISIIAPYKRENGELLPVNKRQFNYYHSRARTLIERTYGRIKNMWRRIHLNKLESNVSKAADIIAACVIMNNITLQMFKDPPINNNNSCMNVFQNDPKPSSFPTANAYRDYYASLYY